MAPREGSEQAREGFDLIQVFAGSFWLLVRELGGEWRSREMVRRLWQRSKGRQGESGRDQGVAIGEGEVSGFRTYLEDGTDRIS